MGNPELKATGTNGHWSVSVSSNHQQILEIESNSLSGKSSFSEAEEQLIRDVARHLISFVGDGSDNGFLEDETEEAEWINSLISDCTCCSECMQDIPCGGLMAGGLCDSLCRCDPIAGHGY